jgi:hypothetical protein
MFCWRERARPRLLGRPRRPNIREFGPALGSVQNTFNIQLITTTTPIYQNSIYYNSIQDLFIITDNSFFTSQNLGVAVGQKYCSAPPFALWHKNTLW